MNKVIYGIEGTEYFNIDTSSNPQPPSGDYLIMEDEPPLEFVYGKDHKGVNIRKVFIAVKGDGDSGKWEYSKEITTEKVNAQRMEQINILAKPLKEEAEIKQIMEGGELDLAAYKNKVKEIMELYPLPE